MEDEGPDAAAGSIATLMTALDGVSVCTTAMIVSGAAGIFADQVDGVAVNPKLVKDD